jgi:serine/threonine protein phosphatase PrpC
MRLPNAILGQPYTCELPLQGSIHGVEGLAHIGLQFDTASRRLHGIPQQVGDFPLTIHLSATTAPITLLLIVNPDPRSLWVAQPSDPTAPFAKPDYQHATLVHAGMQALCASQRGRAHAQAGGQREDEAQIGIIEGRDWLFAVVADGAGSAKWAREGSRLACTTFSEQLAQVAPATWTQLEGRITTFAADMTPAHGTAITDCLGDIIPGIIQATIHAIHDSAAQLGCPVKDFATTLVIGLVWAMPNGQHFTATWGIGDSPAVLLNTRLAPDLLHAPEEGDFSGETHFLTDDSLLDAPETLLSRTSWRVLGDFQALVLMSDGVYDAQFETQHALRQTDRWQAMWQELQPSIQAHDATPLLRWLDFWSLGNHDDRSIALIGRHPANSPVS